jgi:hypothetical protein
MAEQKLPNRPRTLSTLYHTDHSLASDQGVRRGTMLHGAQFNHAYPCDGGAILVRFTDLSIKAAKPPAAGYTSIWDSALRGFGLRISAHGTKIFCVLIGRGRRQTIGRYGPKPRTASGPAVMHRDNRPNT